MSQQELPSGVGLTALIVANERRIETERPDRMFRDDLAGAFCAAARRLRGPEQLPGIDVTRGDLMSMLRGYVALRTRFLDDLVLEACNAGCRQVVILAVGLDARAFRLAWPDGTRLFELDVPDVLAFKRAVLDEASAVPLCERREIAVDLREDWPAALLAAGFNPGEPTAWLVEGLLIYLSEEDNDRIFEAISALSAPGSHLGVEHANTAMLTTPEILENMNEMLGQAGVIWKSGMDRPVEWLARHGWKAEVLDPVAFSAALGRAVPPLLHRPKTEARLWLLHGTRA
jgi:methyltransferase (TIGR00027 family)